MHHIHVNTLMHYMVVVRKYLRKNNNNNNIYIYICVYTIW